MPPTDLTRTHPTPVTAYDWDFQFDHIPFIRRDLIPQHSPLHHEISYESYTESDSSTSIDGYCSEAESLYSARTAAFMPVCQTSVELSYLSDLADALFAATVQLVRLRAFHERTWEHRCNFLFQDIWQQNSWDSTINQIIRLQYRVQRQSSSLRALADICADMFNCPHCSITHRPLST